MATAYVTRAALAAAIRDVGLTAGDVVIVHASLSAFGYVIGGAQTVVDALLDVLTDAGTLVMPAHTPENADPDGFAYPPIPRRHRATWRAAYPAFDGRTSPCPGMGAVADALRAWPGVRRSTHPLMSFCALGAHAAAIVGEHPLECGLGDRSPLGAIYRLGGRVLLLGAGHDSNTSFHLAEARAGWSARRPHGAAITVAGERRWITYEDHDWDESAFAEIGAALDRSGAVARTTLGAAVLRLVDQPTAVDFAERWMRARSNPDAAPIAPELRGDGMRLREPTLDDAGWLAGAFDAATARFLSRPLPAREDDAEDLLCAAIHALRLGDGGGTWIVELADGTPAGLVSLARSGHEAEATVVIGAAHRRRRLGAAALATIAAAALATPEIARITAVVDRDDVAGQATARRAGFTQEGVLRRHRVRAGFPAEPRDSVLFSRVS